jgi:hypothetical protein
LLLAEAKEFATNRKRVLSPAKTKDVKIWLATKAKPWCNRYGGNWDLVEKLLKVSGREVNDMRAVKALATTTVLMIVSTICGIITAILGGNSKSVFEQFMSMLAVLFYVSAIVMFFIWITLGFIVIVRKINDFFARKVYMN